MNQFIAKKIQESIAVKNAIAQDEQLLNNIQHTAAAITSSLQAGHKILFCGNGGSAADAQHLAAEFSGRFYKDRLPLYAEALHCNTSYMTAVGNDYGYDQVYSRILRGIGQAGDVLVAISTSGNSGNILEAIKTAKEKGMIVVGMTGHSGGKMKDLCDYLLNMPSDDTPRIQESHITVGHIICEIVENNLFGA
ncbi:D-sedoheptulose 7-phosphate isomerase [Chitinophaga terrae (ex Kim and Jung 2007)]|jgi:D-sedoheptulose 7-phosphate isomerase|uniref:Phosphoheptose isomerase n=1 Tax=Chitinophaga terrae (ex Kim and Jung 2007) TaxID=408074 RepID=A0A1H3ZB67_9BACT|nr:D-sedoheptulose 7-phosphate isomerase [Chitinophaga terrae (ex Kim and Jung 2007)]MDQ0109255.1 D-sedoheptulose 7-phosphate isomerase [Chitinophaga terrae (ex Kim and Jung 2007)]GEP88647.1 phosphoheptose isomerase [Chitinophaga terrae (ex Kim and Jung 2007)]SEA20572.1 D-sedoheptulose 7-phosphate isomerase [Chitinophaga terrae (ex Kim and Jung 2007)]